MRRLIPAVGTRSILWGVHQFLIHPLFLLIAWTRLYGFPWDYRIWCAAFLHDIGYAGCAVMDNEDGERHVEFGAKLMTRLFDGVGRDGKPTPHSQPEGWIVLSDGFWLGDWGKFTLTHSRFYCKKYNLPFSRLCVADKYVIAITPRWLYLLLANLSGEIKEYMYAKHARSPAKADNQWQWITDLQAAMYVWVAVNKNLPAPEPGCSKKPTTGQSVRPQVTPETGTGGARVPSLVTTTDGAR
jgi:hypothetical protein